MEKMGNWSYWFTKDGKEIINSTNKVDVPKGIKYVKLFKVHKPDGNIDDELSIDDEIFWVKSNINKLTPCDKFDATVEELRKIYKALNVKYPEKDYKKILKKKIKGTPNLKRCRIR